MKMFLSSLIMMLSFIMIFLNNPLSMGLMILTQTMMTCLLSGMLVKTYWFSYILLLTFLGGLLVLFIYISSIASNELFNVSPQMKIMMIMLILSIFLIQTMNMKNMTWLNLSMNSDMNNIFNLNMFNNENKTNLNKLYNNQTFMLMNMMVIYLFITLIIVVKITNIFYGPLRSSKF